MGQMFIAREAGPELVGTIGSRSAVVNNDPVSYTHLVLVGLRQGEGKSTFVRWLAMDDAFFREVTVLEGQKGSEAVEGAWICEMAELLALRRAKDAEAVTGCLLYTSRCV